LTPDEVATLGSLERVDEYPLYTMRYYGSYPRPGLPSNPPVSFYAVPIQEASGGLLEPARASTAGPASQWACSLFAALGDAGSRLYGRNFDWKRSPALLLFTDPPDGYASVSMVDIAYLGFGGDDAPPAADLPLGERRALRAAPYLPFDGMNEQGLAVGMAAVPAGSMRPDPSKETIGSLEVIREMLDHAGNVDEATGILARYNVDMEGGPPLHYMLADRTGRAVVVEFYRGEMKVFPNEHPWHQATNFLLAVPRSSPIAQCGRYDEMDRQLATTQGEMSAAQALDLLARVAQPHTQWSVVYQMSTGEIQVVMGRQYGAPYSFSLSP
jgi:hypothetical protein